MKTKKLSQLITSDWKSSLKTKDFFFVVLQMQKMIFRPYVASFAFLPFRWIKMFSIFFMYEEIFLQWKRFLGQYCSLYEEGKSEKKEKK